MYFWPTEQRKVIEQMLQNVKQQGRVDEFAVFDADNTLWEFDLEESLLVWLEYRGLISLSQINPSLFPIPPKEKESVWDYYQRLCSWDHSICYLWAVQALGGFCLEQLKFEVDAMMQFDDPKGIPTTQNQEIHYIPVPKIFRGQQDLLEQLRSFNIEPWVVSASAEEVVRMVVSDPKYGLHIKPEHVIGVNLLLMYPNGTIISSAEEGKKGCRGDFFASSDRKKAKLTHHVYAPMTWYGGKLAAIKEWIHPSKRPILVAGDSPNDFFMQFYTDVQQQGIRLRIHRKESHREQLRQAIKKRQSVLQPSDPQPEKGWVEVTPMELHYQHHPFV